MYWPGTATVRYALGRGVPPGPPGPYTGARNPLALAGGGAVGKYWKQTYLAGCQPAAGCHPAPHSGKPQTVLAILRGRGGRIQGRQAD